MTVGMGNLEGWLDHCGGPTEDGLKYAFVLCEPIDPMQSDQAWADLCEFALPVAERAGVIAQFERQFQAGVSPASAMMDNYVLAALAAHRVGAGRDEPLVAYAALNKHEFAGVTHEGTTEIACIRVLHWAGWDLNARLPSDGMTALHLMSALRYAPGSDPRVVAWLLSHGADARARNHHGDTPLAYLCGISVWGPAQLHTLALLLLAGGDPLEPADDGTTALSHLKSRDEKQPIPLRGETIAALESDLKRGDGADSPPEKRWGDTLMLLAALELADLISD